MPKFQNQVLINRPVFQVFQYVGDFNNDVHWRNVQGVGITSGDPIRAGSMVAMTRRIVGRKGFVNCDVTDYERNKKIELKGSYWGFPFFRQLLSNTAVNRPMSERRSISAPAGCSGLACFSI